MKFTVRPYRDEDAYAVPTFLRERLHADPISDETFMRQVVLDRNFQPEGALVAESGGAIVGFLLAIARSVPLENAPDDSHRGYITLLAASPERAGVGSALLEAGEAYLRGRGRAEVWVSPYSPGYFIPGVDVSAYAAGVSFFEKHGYAVAYRPVAMETSLWSRPDLAFEIQPEPGLYVGPFGPKIALALLGFATEEFPGDWVRVVRETMANHPERLLVAIRTGDHGVKRVVGFSHFNAERFGPIGVSPSERGKGIGQRLMVETLRAQRDAGYRTSWFMWSDDRTADRLYNNAGFREVRRFVVLKKTL